MTSPQDRQAQLRQCQLLVHAFTWLELDCPADMIVNTLIEAELVSVLKACGYSGAGEVADIDPVRLIEEDRLAQLALHLDKMDSRELASRKVSLMEAAIDSGNLLAAILIWKGREIRFSAEALKGLAERCALRHPDVAQLPAKDPRERLYRMLLGKSLALSDAEERRLFRILGKSF